MSDALCAFLRGVNVNGRTMKMDEVCQVFRSESVQNVRSVLATGNILFESVLAKSDLRRNLEKRMADHYRMDISMIIKNKDEVEAILRNSPFPTDPDMHVYAFICENGFERILMDRFSTITPTVNEKAQISECQFYWQVSKGMTLDSGFSKILGEKQMKDQFTSRNINTIQKIFDKMT